MSEGARVLLIANSYPSDKALYRNGFIHRRVKAYQRAGVQVQIFYMHPPVAKSYIYEFDGVEVVVGNRGHLRESLVGNSYAKILIHFASPDMVEPILEVSSNTPVIVWIHGFEAEAWHRRWFNFLESSASIHAALEKRDSYYAGQLEFMGWLYQTDKLSLTFVHVSKWFQENIVEPDAGVPTQNSHVIPNLIDDKLFTYEAKEPSQRLRILSIRPYASRKYANDLTAKAIELLSERPFFSKLEFEIRGDGALFDAITAPLKKFDNVRVVRGFLPQTKIAEIHKEYGIMLCPTRFDSQGVSMCEAMASGLVPISNDVSAISEFVQHGESGLLAPPEDAAGLAEKIEQLYYNEELFQKLSSGAAESVRRICSEDVSISAELALILPEGTAA